MVISEESLYCATFIKVNKNNSTIPKGQTDIFKSGDRQDHGKQKGNDKRIQYTQHFTETKARVSSDSLERLATPALLLEKQKYTGI